MKRLAFTLLASVLIITARAYDFSAVTPTGQTLYYNITSDSSVVVISPNGSSWSGYALPTGALEIPSSVTYNGYTYSVTSIGSRAFWNCSALTSITIPNSVTSIGDYVFQYCSGLTSMSIPRSVASIGSYAFNDCTALTTLYYNARNCSFPNSASYTPFYNMTSLRNVVIGNSVRVIPFAFLYGCSNVNSVVMGDSVTYIGKGAFYGCRSIPSLSIPNMTTTIREDAFCNCSALQSISLPSSITAIREYTFSGCSQLRSISFGGSITSFGAQAFVSCTNMDSVLYTGTIENWCAINFTDILSNPLIQARHLYINGTELTHLTIPNTIHAIKKYSFPKCGGLVSVTIPNSVTSIGTRAFWNCYNLSTITLGDSITTMGDSVFSYCFRLSSVSLPNTLTEIKKDMFNSCSALRKVELGNDVRVIGERAFKDCAYLDTTIIHTDNPPLVQASTFSGVGQYTTIIVPCEKAQWYSAANNWSYFHNIVEDCARVYLSVSSNDEQMGSTFGEGEYILHANAILYAIPRPGNSFSAWHDGDTNNPRLVSLLSDSSFVAIFYTNNPDSIFIHDTIFEEHVVHDTTLIHDTVIVDIYIHDTIILDNHNYYTLSVLSANNTQGVGVGTGNFCDGTNVEVCALPLDGYRFSQWNDGSTENPRTVTVHDNTTLIATFTERGSESINQPNESINIHLYPNPTTGMVNIEGAEVQSVEAIDLQGRILLQSAASQIDLSELSSGSYILRITTSEGVAIRRIVKR